MRPKISSHAICFLRSKPASEQRRSGGPEDGSSRCSAAQLASGSRSQSFRAIRTGIRSKSAAHATADAWVGLEAFAIAGDERPRALRNEPIAATDALAFAYRNISESPFPHLMIFGFAANGEVVWYYPEYTDPSTDPRSISMERGALDLPDRVSHDLPAGTGRAPADRGLRPAHPPGGGGAMKKGTAIALLLSSIWCGEAEATRRYALVRG